MTTDTLTPERRIETRRAILQSMNSPYFWMLMMQNSSLHNTAHTEGCTK